jgi:hypothetical protein
LTHVPPISLAENIAVDNCCDRACNAAPCPPTPQPIIATSKSYEPGGVCDDEEEYKDVDDDDEYDDDDDDDEMLFKE